MLSLSTPSSLDAHLVTISGQSYELNYAYDNVLRWFDLVESDLPEMVIAYRTLLMFVGPVDATDEETLTVYQQVVNDVSQHPYGNDAQPAEVSKWERAFDFNKDAEAIFASFMEQYHIDLVEAKGKLSWFKFKAMLDGLDPETPLERIIKIRKADLSEYKGKALNEIVEAQNYYSLAQTEEERKEKADYDLQKQFDNMIF